MRNLKILFGVVLISIVITDSVYLSAQNRPRPRRQCEDNFINADTDKDGRISLKEFMAVRHPGKISPEEMFKFRDTNKDGFLTKSEFCSKGSRNGRRPGKGR